jgi:hypothetical protein
MSSIFLAARAVGWTQFKAATRTQAAGTYFRQKGPGPERMQVWAARKSRRSKAGHLSEKTFEGATHSDKF